MYTVTFYSYKGGVGRTMALTNVAYLLGAGGKRVLLIDFDLEAPGLSSYDPFREGGARRGLVEYITEYIETNRAPDVAGYINKFSAGEANLWLLSAGNHTDPSYAMNYSAINWQNLYKERSGFLLFEDLKQQIANYEGVGFDYVLIDSRTGHTDIGGICTRQLPDAVVVMFIPTPQNVDGLKPIVKAISREGLPVRREKIKLHFCPSNLPDLDDQELILKALLDRAQSELGYVEASAAIQHYGALDLLQQPIYAHIHPRSRLAKQYENLKTSIEASNLADRDGALIALERMLVDYSEAQRSNNEIALQVIHSNAALIRASFPSDAAIAWRLAALANRMTRPEDELAALDVVVELGDERALALLRRANARATLDNRRGAAEDLGQLLTRQRATLFEVRPAVDLLKVVEPKEWRSIIEKSLLNPEIDSSGKSHLILALLDERDEASRVVQIAKEVMSAHDQSALKTAYVLALMADGQFPQAMRMISEDSAAVRSSNAIDDVFNYAICEWATTGSPPRDLLERVLSLRSMWQESSDSNSLQCFALCRAVLGERDEALEDIRAAKLKAKGVRSVFSCWRYLMVAGSTMIEDLDEMASQFAEERAIGPPEREGLRGAYQRQLT